MPAPPHRPYFFHDKAVAGSGWEAVHAHQPRHRLAKRDFKLVFETP